MLKIKASKKRVPLSNYIWGLGLEHEMHIFHKPKKDVKDFILYDSETARDRLIKDIKEKKIKIMDECDDDISDLNIARILTDKEKDLWFNEDDKYVFKNHTEKQKEIIKGIKKKINRYIKKTKNLKVISKNDYNYLMSVPYEKTGRKCNGQWVIQRVPYDMPEFIIDEPITNINGDRSIYNMCKELTYNKERYIKMLMKNKITQQQVKKYGELVELPVSMTSFLKHPENSDKTKYTFKKNKKKIDITREEYTGSYHITMTLPYLPSKTTLKEFTNLHSKFANQLQWLEPLLLTGFFSCDQRAPGSLYNRVKGSYRVLIIGWGNLAGSDVRKFGEGIGRYCNVPIKWRKGLNLHDVKKINPCLKPSPPAQREGARSTLSSDFRTVGEVDDNAERKVAPMTLGKGIEFRIFDHFNDEKLYELVKLMSFVAENSRVFKTKKYVYNNKNWINGLHNIMENGWCAELDKKYIDELRKNLNLKIKTDSVIAHDILCEINEELFRKHKNGKFPYILNPNIKELTDRKVKNNNG